MEEQLAEFDTEREQLRSRLKKEEAHCCQLQHQVCTVITMEDAHLAKFLISYKLITAGES